MSLKVKINYLYSNFQSQDDEPKDLLKELSNQWLLTQMKHQASAEAANAFWNTAFKHIPDVVQQTTKKIPKFIQQRRKIFEENCPKVHLEYCYRNKVSGDIITYKGTTAPVKQFGNTQKFEKLYEMAYVKVNISM